MCIVYVSPLLLPAFSLSLSVSLGLLAHLTTSQVSREFLHVLYEIYVVLIPPHENPTNFSFFVDVYGNTKARSESESNSVGVPRATGAWVWIGFEGRAPVRLVWFDSSLWRRGDDRRECALAPVFLFLDGHARCDQGGIRTTSVYDVAVGHGAYAAAPRCRERFDGARGVIRRELRYEGDAQVGALSIRIEVDVVLVLVHHTALHLLPGELPLRVRARGRGERVLGGIDLLERVIRGLERGGAREGQFGGDAGDVGATGRGWGVAFGDT